jgi:flavin-dependent dehydrogenase
MSTLIEQQKAIGSGSHALVIGSSIAGLVAARVLLNHFERVTVVERDHLPQAPEPRPGVPQASHVHVLLIQGQKILEQLFPGLEAELIAAGAPLVDWTADLPWLNVWGWASRFPSNLVSLTCSRSLLEWLVRRRLNTYPNLQFLQACQVKGLMANKSKSRVTGVKLHFRDEPHEAELAADLVVDASGRNSQMPKWLEALDYPPPSETVVNSFLGYSTRWYERPENFQADWKLLNVSYKLPHDQHGGVLYSVEKNRWVVTLVGIGRDYPPTDEAGFLEFVRNLRSPVIYEAIKDARPISPIYGYRRTENCWRHYEKLSRLPEG